MKATLRGPFRVLDDQGADRTPKGMKERALLALLLLSPGQRRLRSWLQDKLWSDRGPEQAQASLRQALSHVRAALGPLSARLRADRSTLWIDPPAALDEEGEGEALSDLDVRDPEWEEWLRDLRQGQGTAGPQAAAEGEPGAGPGAGPGLGRAWPGRAEPQASARAARPVVLICTRRPEGGGNGSRFVARTLSSRVASVLMAAGDVEVIEEEVGPSDQLPGPFDAAVEIEAWSEPGLGATGTFGPTAFALARTLGPPRNRSVWTGRTKVALGMRDAWEGAEAQALANRAAQSVIDLTALSARLSPFAAVSRAVRRIYDFDAPGLAMADALLKGAQEGDAAPLALAWRGLVRLTRDFEFREGGEASRGEAAAMAAEAALRAPGHAVVLALAAKVQMGLGEDPDLGRHLAGRAVAEDDANPYALDALSEALIGQGDFEGSHRAALAGRQAADGLAHSFSWDMAACLAALSLGRLDEAREHALASHRKMPVHRPALRYLVALSLLAGRREEADRFAARLRALEPDFAPRLLLAPDYPVHTLRALGLADALARLLAR